MGFPVYSERFIATEQVGEWIVYTVPENQRAVVRMATFSNPGTAAASCWLSVHGISVWFGDVPANQTTTLTGLHVPVYERETIRMFTYGTVISMVCAGYVFNDQGPGNPPPNATVRLAPPGAPGLAPLPGEAA